MIKYNNNTINDWNFDTSNIIKVYRNNAMCYYKISGGDTPTTQTPCFAVVDNISQYSDTEFEDVFNKADGKWYKLNNLNEYEEYGVYGSGRTISYYDGKLTIDGDYEYIYSGSSWVNVGEVSGSTATLPNVPFVLNYNAKNYDASTHTIQMTTGQLNDTDAVAVTSPSTIVDHSSDGYITISNSTMRIRKVGQDISLLNRSSNSTSSDLTIVCKAKTTGGENIITNRDTNYNWMYRLKTSGTLTFHGTAETGSISWNTSNPDIMSVRTYYDSGTKVKYNNWTQNTSSTPTAFTYGSTNTDSSTAGALFTGFAYDGTGEQWTGDFYWVYLAQANLTDSQVQEVITYNESSGGTVEYPIYYDEIQDPPNNVSFSSMTEAEEYECPWVGMNATIDGDRYIFSGDSTSGYEWVYQPSRLPSGYQEVEYVENTSSAYINLGIDPYSSTSNSFTVECTFSSYTQSSFAYLISCEYASTSPYYGFILRWNNRNLEFNGGSIGVDTTAQNSPNGDGTSAITFHSDSTTTSNSNTPISLFCGISGGSAWRNGKGRLYDLKMTLNNVVVRELVPCIRDNDSMVGLYDISNDVFYYPPNYTLYQLVAGPNV